MVWGRGRVRLALALTLTNSNPNPNATLRRAVQAAPSLHWLDFFDQLLSPDGEALADGLALDGTHLHPSYVPLLEAALPR